LRFARGERISPGRRIVTMINGGNATVYVSTMDNAIRFYTGCSASS
jgi:hypothetical protein